MSSFFKSFDGFASIPHEYKDHTFHGGLLSISAVCLLIFLLVLEVGSFLTTRTTSTVLLDENFTDTISINFDITMLDLPCKYATVNLRDELGYRSVNVTENISKKIFHWKRGNLIPGDVHEDKEVDADLHLKEVDRNVELDEGGHHSLHIVSEDQFTKVLKSHQMVFVDFYAPWCHWCTQLAPTWEKAAARFDNLKFLHKNLNVKFVSINCDQFSSICSRYEVRAFPALLRFKGQNPLYPFYEDSRTEEKLISYFKSAVEDFEHHMINIYKYEACRLSGVVEVSRVPGVFYIEGRNPPGQNLSPSMTNVSHLIHNFNFGPQLIGVREVLVPRDHKKKVRPLNEKNFIAANMHTAPHHYLKVVSVSFGKITSLFGGNFFEMTSQNRIAYYGEEEVPSAAFSYDISPLSITVTNVSVTWYDFMTNILGIMGGTFTCVKLFDGVIFFTKEQVKKALKKQD